jgi:hypothetical protein
MTGRDEHVLEFLFLLAEFLAADLIKCMLLRYYYASIRAAGPQEIITDGTAYTHRVAITAHSMQGMEALLSKSSKISAILTGAQVEKEEHWVTCIVPNLPPEYPAYEGGTQVLLQSRQPRNLNSRPRPNPYRAAGPGHSQAAALQL